MNAEQERLDEERTQLCRERIDTIQNKTNREDVDRHATEFLITNRPSSLMRRLDTLLAFAKHLGDRHWLDVTREDVIHVIGSHKSQRGKHFAKDPDSLPHRGLAKSTQSMWVSQIRAFLTWLNDDEVPKAFKKLPFTKKKFLADNARDRSLTPKQVRRLYAAARTKRNRAIILVALELGCRPSELAALTFKFVELRDHGYWFYISEDIGVDLKERPARKVWLPVILAATVLEEWLQEHPNPHDPEARVFVTMSPRSHGNPMCTRSINDVVKTTAQRAKLEKHVTAHGLRHTAASFRVARGMAASALRDHFGWKSMAMADTYASSTSQYEDLALEVLGLRKTEPGLADVIGSTTCRLCGGIIRIGETNCTKCGVVNSEAIQQAEEHRRREAALDFIAIDLAQALGYHVPESQQNALHDAKDFLWKKFRTTRQGISRHEFVTWCLRAWTKELGGNS